MQVGSAHVVADLRRLFVHDSFMMRHVVGYRPLAL